MAFERPEPKLDFVTHFDPNALGYSLGPNVTTGWFIWNFFTKIVSQQTCVLYETCFVKKFQMNQPVVTFGTREYASEGY